MTQESISLSDYAAAVKQMSGQPASGWSEAAGRFAERVAAEGGAYAVSEARKFELAAAELGAGFRSAAENARHWADAARASGSDSVAHVYDRYAERYYEKANQLLDSIIDKKSALDAVAREAKAGAEAAEKALGGGFGHALGPAFDAAQMVEGLLDWASTGSSDKFGGACMGVALSAGLGILGAALGVAFGLPAIAVAALLGLRQLLAVDWGIALMPNFEMQ